MSNEKKNSLEKFGNKDDEEARQKALWMDKFIGERPDLFPSEWPELKKKKAQTVLKNDSAKSRMYASIPIICRGAKCPYKDVCPLFADNLHPEGDRCPIERDMVAELMVELIDELGVDPGSATEVAMVRDLVNSEIQHIRVTNLLAQESFMQDVFAGMNEATGEIYFNKDLHKAIDFEDKILKRKESIRKQMLATREAKAKVLGIGQVDKSRAIAEAIYDIEEVRISREKAAREKLGRSSIDLYIEDSMADIADAEIVIDHDDDNED